MELTVRKKENVPNVAILEKGFRPFFLLCGLFATIWIPLWSYRFSTAWDSDWISAYWHAHEMVFGFFIAMVAGFLLTAVENWTGAPVVKRKSLFFLVLLWIAGRVVYVSGSLTLWRVIIETSFLPCLLFFVGRSIIRARSKRNYKIIAVLSLFTLLNFAFSYAVLMIPDQTLAHAFARGSIYIVLLLVLIIAGRVFPFFTERKVGLTTKNIAWIEIALPILVVLDAILQFFPLVPLPEAYPQAVVSIIAGSLIFLRMQYWQTATAIKVPMLAVLHFGHIFIGLGFFVQAAASLFNITNGESLSLHILIIGGLSLIGIGMMTRVSLGHSGRIIIATFWHKLSFILIALSCLVRAILPIFLFQYYTQFVEIGSVLWALGFLIYVISFAKILVWKRIDGRAG